MAISYEPLWRTLATRKINMTEMRKRTGIATATMAKLRKNESLTLAMIDKICKGLDCPIEQVVAIISDDERETFNKLEPGTLIRAKLPGLIYNTFAIQSVMRLPTGAEYTAHPFSEHRGRGVEAYEVEYVELIPERMNEPGGEKGYIFYGPNTQFTIKPSQIQRKYGSLLPPYVDILLRIDDPSREVMEDALREADGHWQSPEELEEVVREWVEE